MRNLARYLRRRIKPQYQYNLQHKLAKKISDTSNSVWQSFAFPLVRRVSPTMIAQQLVNVQPMTLPTGSSFWGRFAHWANATPRQALYIRELNEWILQHGDRKDIHWFRDGGALSGWTDYVDRAAVISLPDTESVAEHLTAVFEELAKLNSSSMSIEELQLRALDIWSEVHGDA